MTEHVTEWHDGDVVEVEFPRKDGTTNGQWYEYVRRGSYWPGDQSWSGKYDSQIMELLRDEHVRLVSCGLRKPFYKIEPELAGSVNRLLDILDVPSLSTETRQALETVRFLVDTSTCNVGIEVLDMSVRGYNLMKRAKINTVSECAGQAAWALFDMRNMGSKTFDDMVDRLTRWARDHGRIPHREPELAGKYDWCIGCRANEAAS